MPNLLGVLETVLSVDNANLNAAEVATGRDFRIHMERLIEALIEPPWETPISISPICGWLPY